MPPNRRDAAALWDIGKAARMVEEFVADRDQQSFSTTPMCHFAVIAQLQIIGEATKRLSTPFPGAKWPGCGTS